MLLRNESPHVLCGDHRFRYLRPGTAPGRGLRPPAVL